MIAKPEYTIGEHRHRFAVWASARAAGRGMSRWKVGLVRDAIAKTELAKVAHSINNLPELGVEEWQLDLASKVAKELDVCFGIGAKVVAIYLKAATLGVDPAIHPGLKALLPPVDRVLIKALAAKYPHLRNFLFKDRLPRAWTKMDREEFVSCIIPVLHEVAGPNTPLWTVESLWDPVMD